VAALFVEVDLVMRIHAEVVAMARSDRHLAAVVL
jgi:hypothetical protein